MKRSKKILLTLITVLVIIFLTGCLRTNIRNIRNCVIIKQHCGFDNLDAGFYHVKDLKTGVISRIDVDIRDCNVYCVGDTIK